ncbi:MAG: hypothetical protein M9899_05595 [Bdellovibrionaceae bacterium]|nr:hypothetical protein [Pseudobdellovibrionaceae bacterium]
MSKPYWPSLSNTNSSETTSTSLKPIRDIASSGNYCFLCQFPPAKFSDANNQKACTDLYGSICTPDNPYLKAAEKQEDQSSETINQNRDKAAQTLGYKNFDDGLKKRLQEAGIKINPNIDPEAWAEARNLLLSPSGSVSDERQQGSQLAEMAGSLFADSTECNPNPPDSPASRARLNRLRQQVRTDYAQKRKTLIQYYKNNIPDFLENELSSRCAMLSMRSATESNKNPEWTKICNDFTRIRREAIMLYRTEGTPGYEEKALAFVTKNFPTTPFYTHLPTDEEATSSGGSLGLETISQELTLTMQCQSYNTAIATSAKKIATNYASDVQRTRTHVESTISSVYSERRKKVADESLNLLRADIQSLVPQLTNDRAKQSKIIEQYNKLELFWLKNPNASAYSRNAQGVDSLSPTAHRGGEPDPSDASSLFSDPSLSFFTHKNAYYNPSSTQGAKSSPEQVNIFPGFLSLLDSNPYAFSGILAHELGHKIGPEISQINAHDMKPEFSELLACYKGRDSIRMQKNQEDEVIADFVSSEVMAHQISKLPKAQQRSAVMAMASTFCDEPHQGIDCKAEHPEGVFRVNGILASNPKIAQVMGCGTSQTNFKQCGIKDLSLSGDSATTPSETPTPRTETTDDAGGAY